MIRMVERYGVPDRAAACIVNGLLKDLGYASETYRDMYLDKNAIRRQRKKCRDQYKILYFISSLYFDGKINKTLLANGKIEKQDHIALISEPNSQYITHAKPNGKSNAENVASAIIDSLSGVNTQSLNVLGCDGTAGNTGHKSGICARLENHLKHKCHWVVSILCIYY